MEVDYSTRCSLNMKKLRHHLQKSLERFVDQVQQRKQETESTHKRSRNNKQKRWQSIKRLRSIIDLKDQPEKWVQLAGHQDCFAVGEEGTILKKMIPIERQALEQLMEDRLKPFVPQFRGVVSHESHQYIEMDDLLHGFNRPCVMDCKMGVRTYLEDELTKLESNQELRPDMYAKMVKVDANEPTAEEHAARAITKPRYMQFREKSSSTATLGFRIEGLKNSEGGCCGVDFKTCKDYTSVEKAFQHFTQVDSHTIAQYLHRLKDLRETLQASAFFGKHEVIGSSLLFVHDDTKASVWMIDFGKTRHLEGGHVISHDKAWERGNHEDGYLIGLTSIINIFENLLVTANEN